MCVGSFDGEPEGKMGDKNAGIILKWVLREWRVVVWTNPVYSSSHVSMSETAECLYTL